LVMASSLPDMETVPAGVTETWGTGEYCTLRGPTVGNHGRARQEDENMRDHIGGGAFLDRDALD